jgi:hypothetical protein
LARIGYITLALGEDYGGERGERINGNMQTRHLIRSTKRERKRERERERGRVF